MINDGLFKKFKIDSVWGIHNWPGIPVGEAVYEGFAMAGGDIIVIEVKGKVDMQHNLNMQMILW